MPNQKVKEILEELYKRAIIGFLDEDKRNKKRAIDYALQSLWEVVEEEIPKANPKFTNEVWVSNRQGILNLHDKIFNDGYNQAFSEVKSKLRALIVGGEPQRSP
jgi:hypothetical protein